MLQKRAGAFSGGALAKGLSVSLGAVGAIALGRATPAVAQTAITSLEATYQNGPTRSYSTTIATPCSPASYGTCGDPVNLDFGVGATNDLTVTGFQSGATSYSLVQLATSINLRRIDGQGATGERQLMFFERDNAGNTQIRSSYTNSMEAGLLSDIANRGVDNAFSNDNSVASNNVERIDYIVAEGLEVLAAAQNNVGFLVLERGGNDPFKAAAITSLDANGNPASFGPLQSVGTGTWGFSGFNINTAVMRREETEPDFRPSHTVNNQPIDGVFLSVSDFGIPAGQTIFGYALFPNDTPNGSSSNDLVNLTNFPTTTSGASGQGGLDLLAGGGIYIADSLSSVSGTLYEDANADDSFDGGEATLPNGIGLTLYQDGNSNGILDAGEEIISTSTARNDGSYFFLGVPNGTYRIFVDTADTDIPSDLTLGTPNDVEVVVAGADRSNIDFGFDDTAVPGVPAGACEVSLINGSFEVPAVNSTPPTPTQVFQAGTIAAYNENDVPGWFSSADDSIEIWRNGNTVAGSALEAQQFAEINAYVAGSLFQDVATVPGSLLSWQFAHRGRTGTDTLNLRIGPTNGTVSQTNSVTGTTSFTTGNGAWVQYQGTYFVPAGQTTTRFEYVAVSTANGNNSTGNFIDAVRFGPLCDHGDADASYPVVRSGGGAAHVNDGVTFLGSSLGIDLDGQPSVGADGDDGIAGDADGVDDEDGVTFTSGLVAGETVTLDVTASVAAPLSAWIDVNADGDWDDAGEQIFTDEPLNAGTNSLSFSLPATAAVGNTYLRFRLSAAGGLAPTGIVGGGEVEDYRVEITQPVASDPEVLLTKRITAINRGRGVGEQLFDNYYVDVDTPDDNAVNWPGGAVPETVGGGTVESYIAGITGVDSSTVAFGVTTLPGDELEYTIPFLSNGDVVAQNVLICDRVPASTQFVAGAFNNSPSAAVNASGNRGILFNFNGVEASLTNANDGNEVTDTGGNDNGVGGYYFPAGIDPSSELGVNVSCGGPNDNGVVVVDLSDIPNAVGEGEPANSYGFIRFRVSVD